MYSQIYCHKNQTCQFLINITVKQINVIYKTNKKINKFLNTKQSMSKKAPNQTLNNWENQDQNNKQIVPELIRLKYQDSIKMNSNKTAYVETDLKFYGDIQKMTKSRENVLLTLLDNKKKKQLTDQECDQIDFLARLHYRANIVNQNTDNEWENIEEKDKCKCGCQKAKGPNISLCASIKQMSVLGSGVVLLFIFKKLFSLILLSVILIYAVFAIATNYMGSGSETVKSCQDAYCVFRTRASSQNKLDPDVYTVVQWWLGVVFSAVWVILLRFIKYFGISQDHSIDKYLNSSSDYAIIIQNLPSGEYEEKDLVAYFDLLYEKALKMAKENSQQKNQEETQNNILSHNKNIFQQKQFNRFNMKNIQIIYNMEFSRAIIQKIIGLSIAIKSIIEVDSQTQEIIIQKNDIQRYRNLKQEICQEYEYLSDLRKKFFYDDNFRKNISTTVAVVEFFKQEDKDIFLKYFGNAKIGLLKQLQEKIKSYFKKASRSVMFRGNVLKIMRAPQPSDLIYLNCEKKSSVSRVLLIYLLTFIIIIFSFGLITLLTYIQERISTFQLGDNSEKVVTVLNIVISVGLQIVNTILWSALFFILNIEYNHSMTQKIVSQMNKVLFATCVNIIALPIISNYVIRNNVYGSKGLAGIVFDYQISILGVGLVMKLIDPGNLIKRILLMIRKARNAIIRFLCKSIINIDPSKGVPEINTLYEAAYFDIAESYVYVMAATFQAAFFCQLQPSLIILVFFVVVFFYWVNKFKVLRTCKIPEITQFLIFETVLSQAVLIPVVYGAGSIVISYIENGYNPKLPINYAPSLISIGLGVLGFFNPGDYLNIIAKWTVEKILLKNTMDEENTSQDISTKDVLNKNTMSDQIINKEPDIMNRLDNYFKNTNSLALIGFEHVLAGGQYNNFPNVTLQEIDRFCQKFLRSEQEMNIIKKKINETIITKIIEGKQNEVSVLKIQLDTKKEKENENSGRKNKKAPNVKLPKLNNGSSELKY